MTVHAARDTAAPSGEARIGEVLKRLREQHGLSLRTLAALAGFSASFLSQLENGQVPPSIASLDRIAAELGVTLANLFEASQAPVAAVVRADGRPGFTVPGRGRVSNRSPPPVSAARSKRSPSHWRHAARAGNTRRVIRPISSPTWSRAR